MIGQTLSNRYKLIAELGSGGMAWVYLAEDLVRERRVAVKVLYPQHGQDVSFLQRFAREAKLSMALSQVAPQQNIVQLLDYGADRDTHYLVMEYVPGQDLGQHLEAEGALAWPVALALARQVALALDHAHCHDIVHRDVKPSNIMLLPDGSVRLLDLGIARARMSPEVTLSGFVGSPNYAAPEQATGKPVDIRSDIYSLGIVLYRMLTGHLPFRGDTAWEVINQHIAATPPPLVQLCPGLPQAVVALVEKAMAKRPEDRFQTPAQMVAALDASLAGEHVPASPLAGERHGAGRDLEALYGDACRAMEAERWQEAIDLFSRCLKIDPGYRDVSRRLSAVGQQIQLAALYRSAQRALERGQWPKALARLGAISEIDPNYKDIARLQGRAERQEPSPGSDWTTQAGDLGPPAGPVPSEAQADTSEMPGQPEPARPDRRFLWAGVPLLLLILSLGGYLLLGQGSPWRAPANSPSPCPSASAETGPSPASDTAPVPTQPSPAAELAGTGAPSPSPRTTDTGPAPGQTTAPTAGTATRPRLTASPTPSRVPTSAASPTPSPPPTDLAAAAATGQPPLTGQIAFPRFHAVAGTYYVHTCRVDGGGCHPVAAEASQPDFLPGGRQLVVHSWKSDQKGLLLIDLEGNLIWQISRGIEDARPSVDFQGEAYVYHSRIEADRQPRLYRTYAAELRPLGGSAGAILGRAPSWTPGGQILYTGCLGNACGILLVGAHGAGARQVVPGGTETDPEASPDGRHVAFMSNRDGNWEVYLVDLDGGNLQRVTDHPGNDGLPTWSPDGRWLAFVSDRGGVWAVWALALDAAGELSEPMWLFPVGGPLEGEVRDAAPHELHGWLEERISWGE